MAVLAVQAIRRMRGGAQSQLMLGADGKLWVVKFQNNPQHLRVLANELIATRLAEAVGLTVPATDVVEVTRVADRQHARHAHGAAARGAPSRCRPGLQFGSRFVGGLMPGQVVDYLPEPQLDEVRNLHEFAGMLALDKWTGNCNGRQAVFDRRPRERKYRATFIDQGFCFNAGEWTFPTARCAASTRATRCTPASRDGRASSRGSRASRIDGSDTLWRIAEIVPPEWYGGDTPALERLMEQMLRPPRPRAGADCSLSRFDREPFPLEQASLCPHSLRTTPLSGQYVAAAQCQGLRMRAQVARDGFLDVAIVDTRKDALCQTRMPCEFFLIRYVPDPVKGEFTNIGVLLREAATRPPALRPVRALHPRLDARPLHGRRTRISALLEALEGEIAARVRPMPASRLEADPGRARGLALELASRSPSRAPAWPKTSPPSWNC